MCVFQSRCHHHLSNLYQVLASHTRFPVPAGGRGGRGGRTRRPRRARRTRRTRRRDGRTSQKKIRDAEISLPTNFERCATLGGRKRAETGFRVCLTTDTCVCGPRHMSRKAGKLQTAGFGGAAIFWTNMAKRARKITPKRLGFSFLRLLARG